MTSRSARGFAAAAQSAVPQSASGSSWDSIRSTVNAVEAALAAAAAFRAAASTNTHDLAALARQAHLAFGEAWERLNRSKL